MMSEAHSRIPIMSTENLTEKSEPEFVPADLAPERKQAAIEFGEISHAMDTDPMGIFLVGEDGMLRSLTADRKVIGAAPLEPRHIKAFLDRMPYDPELEKKYRGADGTKIPQEQWFSPRPGILPPPLAADKYERGRKMIEERGGSFDVITAAKRKEERDARTSRCPIVIRSDYDLERPKTAEESDASRTTS